MYRVRQKTATDCFAACIASILEIPLSEIPHPPHSTIEEGREMENSGRWKDYIAKIQEEVMRPRGLYMVFMDSNELEVFGYPSCQMIGLVNLMSLKHPSHYSTHAVVCRGRVVVWDPLGHSDWYKNSDIVKGLSGAYMILPDKLPGRYTRNRRLRRKK